MKNWRTPLLALATLVGVWFVKFYLNFPSADTQIVGIILTIASILFGFLAGFFISELWSRYTEIRTLQGSRSADGLNMITYAQHFFTQGTFKKKFIRLTEKSCIADEIVEWNEGHLELPYYRAIAQAFDVVRVNNIKDQEYFDKLLASYQELMRATVKLDSLGKERLFFSEWFVLSILSVIIGLSVLFLDASHIFAQAITFIFPTVIVLALSIVYDLDTLLWSKEIVSLEPNQRLFDALGLRRFYLKKKRRFISPRVKQYRTENDLRGALKAVHHAMLESRKYR